MNIPEMDDAQRVLFTVIYSMRGVTPRDLAAALGFDGQWVWKAVLWLERHGLVERQGGIVKPAAWTLGAS